MYRFLLLFSLVISIACQQPTNSPKSGIITQHEIDVALDPVTHSISGTDILTVKRHSGTLSFGFLMNSSLDRVELVEPVDLNLTKKTLDDYEIRYGQHVDTSEANRLGYYEVELQIPDTVFNVTIGFSGEIYDSLSSESQEYARGFEQTTGLIESRGIYLSGASYWIPTQNQGMFTYRLTTRLPKAWSSISQGEELTHDAGDTTLQVWSCDYPMEEVYLVASKYYITNEVHNGIRVSTFLFENDPELSAKYIAATERYLDLYSGLIGKYPFSKFVLVENFWQTGYGMPSFTLLGSQVIRLPFIIYTSYGHEILHNWWGNGVFVDWEKGNWCEGLTNYMADHYYKKQTGQDANYRRTMLQTFLNYVQEGNDFPLVDFRERHSPASQAVGYSKSAMVFHMLHQMLGEEKFIAAIRDFYQTNKFKAATWDDLKVAFEKQYNQNLDWFFNQWITRTGAPTLSIESVQVESKNNEYQIDLKIDQTKPLYRLNVPVLISGAKDTTLTVALNKQSADDVITLPWQPKQISVDPNFDVFRFLDRSEIPPALSQTMGAEKATIILPGSGNEALKNAYDDMATNWRISENVTVVYDYDIPDKELPLETVWIVGNTNMFDAVVRSALTHELTWQGADWKYENQIYPEQGHSQVITIRHPGDEKYSVTYLNVDQPNDLPVLLRKIPHYGKYGYLIFEDSDNVLKGEWQIQNSPLIKKL
ncbi:hypothetical protein JW960_27325 [candidate division KSB1 bacterium]|nr:hypothetical protein [candidate division KSB1 bacterium]